MSSIILMRNAIYVEADLNLEVSINSLRWKKTANTCTAPPSYAASNTSTAATPLPAPISASDALFEAFSSVLSDKCA